MDLSLYLAARNRGDEVAEAAERRRLGTALAHIGEHIVRAAVPSALACAFVPAGGSQSVHTTAALMRSAPKGHQIAACVL